MRTQVKTYQQKLDEERLKQYPKERWRCDIILERSSHHGVGETEAEAILNAAMRYFGC